jgi:5'-methylthioadenosine phosphorylase
MPAELNHRANIWAMKSLGVKWIISVSAVGSLQPQFHPCDIVFIDQFVDKTKQSQNHTFFGQGIVAHIAFAHPICEQLRQILLGTAQDQQVPCHDGGSYVNMEGPAFSTKAESLLNHHAECAVIGMTNLGEAKCAREAEISYATMAMVTDYDAWNEDHDHVTVEQVIEYLHRNTNTARRLLSSIIPKIPKTANWPAHDALQNAIITQRDYWPQETIQKLGPILDRYV